MIAALSAWHEQHEAAAAALKSVAALPAHVMLESYSVLTRLPGGLAVPAAAAAAVLADRFDQRPLELRASQRARVPAVLAAAGVLELSDDLSSLPHAATPPASASAAISASVPLMMAPLPIPS